MKTIAQSIFILNRIINSLLVLLLLVAAVPHISFAQHEMAHHGQEHSSSNKHSHHKLLQQIPIGIMGGHTHEQGSWMISYRYMLMNMDGNRIGTNSVSNKRVLEDYMVAPTDMNMQMHMFGLMYAPTDSITLMTMIPYVIKSMNHITRSGDRFKTEADGIGDIKLTGLIKIFERANNQIHLNASMTMPTGSIDQKGNTPAGDNMQLPYPMQLGSGTVDLLPGVTYVGMHDSLQWGTQLIATIRLGDNSRDYKLGNKIEATAWGSWNWFNWVSTSLRLDWQSWGNIKGADPALNPMMVPTADPNLRGGKRLDALAGLNFFVPKGPTWLKGQKIGAEFGMPVYQDLDGPQLETDWILWLGWQYDW